MLETIHIFDEFFQSSEELTKEQRHQKRIALDPFIYSILQHKYGSKLESFWKSHTVPSKTDSYIVIVERRLHPNLAFILYNAAYFASNYGIILVCSDTNYEYCKELCQDKDVLLLPMFTGIGDPVQGKQDYNTLLKQKEFYESLPGSYLLFLEMDCYIRKSIPEEWKQYDLIAAPYEWDESSCGGGFSFRNKSAMISICKSFPDTTWAQDTYLCDGAKALHMKMPDFLTAVTYISESCLYEDPIGVHQWWTFFFPNQLEDSDVIFHSLVSLAIE